MGGYLAYPEYKDSGVEWLGEIPSHWNLKRLKFPISLINEKLEAENSDLSYMGLEHIQSWTGERIEDENAASEGVASRFLPNDVLFGKLRPYLAKVYLAKHEGLISTEALVFRGNHELNPSFLRYYLVSKDFINIVDSSTFGAKMPRASWEFIGNLPMLVPPLLEQRSIARFLDYKTAQIDALIAKKENLLAKLAEKRTALISQAVTQGLDPTVPLKPSSIDWLGHIPAHWKVIRLKYLSEGVTVGIVITPAKYYVDEGVPCLRSLNVKEGRLENRDLVYISEESNELLKKSKIYEGDLVAVRTGQPGTTAIVTRDFHEANCIDLIVIRKSEKFDSRFFSYQLNSPYCKDQFGAGSGGAIQQHFNIETACNLLMLTPPIIEQREIVQFLDDQITEINFQITKVMQAVQTLKEYRTALITNAVTGKIDVRDVKLPQPDSLEVA